jgi:hypothetical protein
MQLKIYVHNMGRFGNNLFQYFIAKIIQKIYNNHIIVYDLNTVINTPYYKLNDQSWNQFEKRYRQDPKSAVITNHRMKSSNIIVHGFFQRGDILKLFRNYLIDLIHPENHEQINKNYRVSDLCKEIKKPNDDDLVLHLRLDDFIFQGNNSQIIHPESYISIIRAIPHRNLIIVVDSLKNNNEIKYLSYFQQFDPQIIQGSLIHDFNYLRYSNRLICSNSTFAWIATFLGNPSERYIPFIVQENQRLEKIQSSDIQVKYKYTKMTDL